MIISSFKFIAFFLISFCILSFPIDQRPLFEHINPHTSIYTEKVFDMVKGQFHAAADKATQIGKQLFENADPLVSDKIDSIKSSTSKIKIRKAIEQNDSALSDSYSREDLRQLNKIISEDQLN